MHAKNVKAGALEPVVESLEERQFLSVALDHGVLTIAGSSGADQISVWAGGAKHSRYIVDINGKTTSYLRSTVKAIKISGGRGDDVINVVGKGSDAVTAKLTVDGGPGRNRLLGLAAKTSVVQSSGTGTNLKSTHATTGKKTGSNPKGNSGSGPAVVTPPPASDASGPSSGTGSTGSTPAVSGTDAGVAAANKFIVYDSTQFLNEPNLAKFGMQKIYLTDREFLAGTYPNYDASKPDEAATRALARRAAALGEKLVLDVENWPIDIRNNPESVVKKNLGKLTQLVDWLHDERPQLQVGFYDLMPIGDYWTVGNYAASVNLGPTNSYWASVLPNNEAKFRQWQAANDYVKTLSDKVNFFCPSLYTFYDHQQGWTWVAKAMMAEAHRIGGGKPVMPFVWMDYHPSNATLGGTAIPADFWKLQLTTVRDNANGIVIWGGWQKTWDDNAPWWQVTKDTLLKAA